MDVNSVHSQFDAEATRKIVTRKVKVFFGRALQQADVENHASRVMVEILRKLPCYDSDRSALNTFVSRVADSALIDLYRQERSDKSRFQRGMKSLNNPLSEIPGDKGEVWQSVNGNSLRSHLGSAEIPAEWLADNRIDLETVFELLDEDEQLLLQQIGSGSSVNDIAAHEGVSRWTIYRRIRRIRKKVRISGIAL